MRVPATLVLSAAWRPDDTAHEACGGGVQRDGAMECCLARERLPGARHSALPHTWTVTRPAPSPRQALVRGPCTGSAPSSSGVSCWPHSSCSSEELSSGSAHVPPPPPVAAPATAPAAWPGTGPRLPCPAPLPPAASWLPPHDPPRALAGSAPRLPSCVRWLPGSVPWLPPCDPPRALTVSAPWLPGCVRWLPGSVPWLVTVGAAGSAAGAGPAATGAGAAVRRSGAVAKGTRRAAHASGPVGRLLAPAAPAPLIVRSRGR